MQDEKERAEKMLQQKEMQYRHIFESVTDALIVVDSSGKIIQANPAACSLYGYTPDEMNNLKHKDFVHQPLIWQKRRSV